MRVLIIIPAFNEEKNITSVYRDISKEYPSADVLIVNDGSGDNTGAVARDLGATVVDLPYNLGIGAAMQTGYRYAFLKGYDIAVQVDGDGQHPANQIGKLIEEVHNGKADMAIGSRFMISNGYKASRGRRIGILHFAGLLSVLLGHRVTDTTSGFRAVNKKVITLFSRYYPEDYPEVEALILLHRHGFIFVEVPVKMKERIGGKSSITPLRSLYYMIKVTLAVLISILRRVEK